MDKDEIILAFAIDQNDDDDEYVCVAEYMDTT